MASVVRRKIAAKISKGFYSGFHNASCAVYYDKGGKISETMKGDWGLGATHLIGQGKPHPYFNPYLHIMAYIA